MTEEGRAHPNCRNASNLYHECNDYCFKVIAEAKARNDAKEQGKLFFVVSLFDRFLKHILTFIYLTMDNSYHLIVFFSFVVFLFCHLFVHNDIVSHSVWR